MRIIRNILLACILFSSLASPVYADFKQFMVDYYYMLDRMRHFEGISPFNCYGWSVTKYRLNIDMHGVCGSGWMACSHNYSIELVGSHDGGVSYHSMGCTGDTGRYGSFDGNNSTATKHYMQGAYYPNINIIYNEYWGSCVDYLSRIYIDSSNASVLSGFDDSLLSGMNPEIFSNGIMVGYEPCEGGTGYKYIFADFCTGQMFWTSNGVCDDPNDPILNWQDYFEPIPTPTPPPPTPLPSTPPTPAPTGNPMPSPQPSPTGTQGNPTPVPTGTEIHYNGTSSTFTDGSYYIDSGIDSIQYSDEVPDKGQDTTEDDTWLDNIMDMVTNHPLIAVIQNSGITTSGEICSVSTELYGKTIELSFCDLTEYLDYFGYFVFAIASIYSYFIIFKVS